MEETKQKIKSVQVLLPNTPKLLDARNRLLASSLRSDSSSFSISDEYPIVLSPQQIKYSLCLVENESVIAHANLWPRNLLINGFKDSTRVGLIGNVATDSAKRNQGIMRKLFLHIEDQARKQRLSYLFLWSDLRQFYQNLGYSSLGQEMRYLFLPPVSQPRKTVTVWQRNQITQKLLNQLLTLRPKIPLTVHRSKSEFHRLLSIPNTYLCIAEEDKRIIAYGIVGKGADMQGVLHEWGFLSNLSMVEFIEAVIVVLDLPYLVILVPALSFPQLNEKLAKYCHSHEEHSMCFGKDLIQQPIDYKNLFIWGLDSI